MTYDFNQEESILFLAYLAYAHDDLSVREANILISTSREFFAHPERLNMDEYFGVMAELVSSCTSESLIDVALSRISPSLYRKVFIYVLEGVVSDGIISNEEKSLLILMKEKMQLDDDFYVNVSEVLLEKYF